MARILIIEDDDYLRENIVHILEFAGFQTLDAGEGETGVLLARRELPDLVICDIMMPGLDGYGVLRALRSDRMTSLIPIIFLTARAGGEHVRYGMALGADDYIVKPFSHQELVAAVHTRLERQRMLEQQYRQQMEDLRLGVVQALPPTIQVPLNNVMGHAEHLIESAADLSPVEIEASADAILQTSEALQRQIENYLLYAQIDIIRLDPARVVVIRRRRLPNAQRVIAQVAENEAQQAGRGQDLQLDLEPVTLWAERKSVKKIVEELVNNAVKFSPPGSPVQVQGRVQGRAYHLGVSDRGEGISPEVVDRVQNPPRLHSALSVSCNVLGLGLLVVRYLVEAHGGQFDIVGTPGQGTSAWVTLPLEA